MLTNEELAAKAVQLKQEAIEAEIDAQRIEDLLSDEANIAIFLTAVGELSQVTKIFIERQDNILKVMFNNKPASFKTVDYRFDANTVTPMVQILVEALLLRVQTLVTNKKQEISDVLA